MARSTKKSAPKKIAKKQPLPGSRRRKPRQKGGGAKVRCREKEADNRSEAKAGQSDGAQADQTAKSSKPSRPSASAIRSANGKASKAGGKPNQTLTIIGNHVNQRSDGSIPSPGRRKRSCCNSATRWWIRWRASQRTRLRSRAEGSEASAFGMHQADAGSDAYDRDFALSLLSQEQDALYEIDEALKRIDLGTYGKCEMSGKPILRARLEAIPFARFTVECQSQLEKQNKASRVRQSVTSLFGLTDEEAREGEEEEPAADDTRNNDHGAGNHHPRMHGGESRSARRFRVT